MTKLSITHPAVLFALAAVCAIALAIWPSSPGRPSIDLYFHATYFVVLPVPRPRHLAIVVGLLFAFYAGVYGLFPKLFGRNLGTSMAQLHFWLSFVAIAAAAIALLSVNRLIGSAGIADSHSLAVATLPFSIAVLIFLLAQAIFVFNVLRSLVKGSEP